MKHTITIEIDLTEDPTRDTRLVLDDIARAGIEYLTENYGISSYEGGQPSGFGGYDGPFVIRAQRTYPEKVGAAAPEELTAGVEWWTSRHPEDVVAMTADNQDALIMTTDDPATGIVWVDPSGLVRKLGGDAPGSWVLQHQVQGVDH